MDPSAKASPSKKSGKKRAPPETEEEAAAKKQRQDEARKQQKREKDRAAKVNANNALHLLAQLLEDAVQQKRIKREEEIKTEDADFWALCLNPPAKPLAPGQSASPRAHPYQIEGVQFLSAMYDCGMGAILGDDMGLGKTMQTVLFILRLRRVKQVKGPILILAPSNLLTQWKSEIEFWCNVLQLDQLPVMIVHGSAAYEGNAERKTDTENGANRAELNRRRWYDAMVTYADTHDDEWPVLITSHALFSSPSEAACLRTLPELGAKPLKEWALTVMDEAHSGKNSKTKLYTALSQHSTKTFLLLTGTIVHNDLHVELITLLNLVLPRVVRSYDMVSRLIRNRTKSLFKPNGTPTEAFTTVIRILYIFLKRRTVTSKSVGISMQPRARCVVFVPQSPLQRALYDGIQDGAIEGEGDRIGRVEPLAFWQLLTDKHPFLIHKIFNSDKLDDPVPGLIANAHQEEIVRRFRALTCAASYKMVLLMQLLHDLTKAGHRTLVFSQSIPVLNMMSILLHLNGYPHDLITGSTSLEVRTMRVNRFNKPESADQVKHIMLLSTKAMGVGVNLAGADTEIFFDHDWNPQNDNQAESRCYRVNQTRPVLVIHLLTEFSAEATNDATILDEKRNMQTFVEHTTLQIRDGDQAATAKGKGPVKLDFDLDMPRLITNRSKWTAAETTR